LLGKRRRIRIGARLNVKLDSILAESASPADFSGAFAACATGFRLEMPGYRAY